MHKIIEDMFQEININFKGGNPRCVHVQAKPDLPLNIVKKGQWMQPQSWEGGVVPLATYLVIKGQMWYPVEFVNNKWYWLEWDNSTKFWGYWTCSSKEISPGTSNLG